MTKKDVAQPNLQALLADFGVLSNRAEEFISYSADTQTSVSQLLNAPNPISSGSTTFYFQSDQADLTAVITLYSLQGKQLKQVSLSTIIGQNSIQMDE